MIKTYAPITLFVRKGRLNPQLRKRTLLQSSFKKVSTMRKKLLQQRSMPSRDSSKKVCKHTLISLSVKRAVKALKRAESFSKYLIRMYQRQLRTSVPSAQESKANHATMRGSNSIELSKAS